MAGDWIKYVKGLEQKPEVVQIAGVLSIPREFVVCRLMKLWSWTDDNIPEENISSTDDSAFVKMSPKNDDNMAFVDALVGTPGFAAAMASACWIRFRHGRIELPNFGRNNGETAKTRARNAKNQKRMRQRQEQKSPGDGDIPNTREEKRREDTDSVSPPPSKSKHPSLTERTGSAARASKRPRLTEEALRSEPLLRAWVADEATRSDAKFDGSEATMANVLATAAKVLRDPTVRDKVAVAKWVIFGRRWDYLSASDEDAAKVLSRGSFTPSQFVLASNFAMRGVE